jgi:hypothetical protein
MELSVEMERPLLKQILTQYIGDLSFEIARTDNFDWRQEMKQDQEVVKGIIEKLDQPTEHGEAESPPVDHSHPRARHRDGLDVEPEALTAERHNV